MKPTLLVLAAGMGSRYGGLKQMDTFGPSGETIMDYSVFDAVRAGFGKVVFVIRRDFEEDFKSNVVKKYEGQIEIELAFQELDKLPEGVEGYPDRVKPWGTGHAVWCASEAIREPFAVINADDFYGKDAFAVISEYLSTLESDDISKQCMVGYQLKNTLSDNGHVSRGVCELDDNNLLESITERTKIVKTEAGAEFIEGDTAYPLTGDEIVSMNMMGFSPVAMKYFESDFVEFMKHSGKELKSEFYLPTVLNNLVQRGLSTVKVLETSSPWFGVTYKEDKEIVTEQINKLVAAGEYPSQLW